MRFDILASAEAYVAYCAENNLLPNRAGFCRYAGITQTRYRYICRYNREKAEIVEAIFEDEALNCGSRKTPAAVLNMYLKSRFGYGETEEGELNVISRHDKEDGE